MDEPSILKGQVGASETMLCSSNMWIEKLEAHLLSKHLDLNEAAGELSSTARRIRFAKDAGSIMGEEVPS